RHEVSPNRSSSRSHRRRSPPRTDPGQPPVARANRPARQPSPSRAHEYSPIPGTDKPRPRPSLKKARDDGVLPSALDKRLRKTHDFAAICEPEQATMAPTPFEV